MRKERKRRRSESYSTITTGAVIKPSRKKKGRYLVAHKNLRILLDTGSSGCVIKAKYAHTSQYLKGSKNEVWHTKAGAFTTHGKAQIEFTLDEFDPHKRIEWPCCVHDSEEDESDEFDLIIGEDLLGELGIVLDYFNKSISWDDIVRPMHPAEEDAKQMNQLQEDSQASELLKEMLADQEDKLDIEYEKTDLEAHVKEQAHLNDEEKRKLLRLSRKYEELFDGTLGIMEGGDFHLQMKEEAPKQINKRCSPLTKKNEELMRTEIERLCKLNVLRKLSGEEAQGNFAFPAFAIKKKDGKNIRFVSPF